jgi:hypothetical protein
MTRWHHLHSTVVNSCQNLTKWPCQSNKERVHSNVPRTSLKDAKYMYNLYVGGNQSWSTASNMTIWQHLHFTVIHLPKSDLALSKKQINGALICPRICLKCINQMRLFKIKNMECSLIWNKTLHLHQKKTSYNFPI